MKAMKSAGIGKKHQQVEQVVIFKEAKCIFSQNYIFKMDVHDIYEMVKPTDFILRLIKNLTCFETLNLIKIENINL